MNAAHRSCALGADPSSQGLFATLLRNGEGSRQLPSDGSSRGGSGRFARGRNGCGRSRGRRRGRSAVRSRCRSSAIHLGFADRHCAHRGALRLDPLVGLGPAQPASRINLPKQLLRPAGARPVSRPPVAAQWSSWDRRIRARRSDVHLLRLVSHDPSHADTAGYQQLGWKAYCPVHAPGVAADRALCVALALASSVPPSWGLRHGQDRGHWLRSLDGHDHGRHDLDAAGVDHLCLQ